MRPFLIDNPIWAFLLAAAALAAALLAARHWRRRRHLRSFLHDVRNRRLGVSDEPLALPADPLLAQLAHEFNALFTAWRHLADDLDTANKRLQRERLSSERQFQTRLRRVEKRAATDPLTRLANRELLEPYVDALFRTAQRDDTDLACLMIDLDHFKHVNDALGHHAGDRLLTFLGKLLGAAVRGSDLAARYGGDEFVLVIERCSHKQAYHVADRLRKIFLREAPACFGASESAFLSLSLSIGIATLRHDAPRCAHELLQRADAALYRAKHAGRNVVAHAS